MNKIIILFIIIFFTQPLYANSILDFEGDNKVKIDEHYKCEDYEDKSIKLELGFHNLNNSTFVLFFNEDEGYTVHVSARNFKSKMKDREIISYIFPFPTEAGLASGAFIQNFNFKNEKIFFLDWFEDKSSIDWVNDHNNLFREIDKNFYKNFDKNLVNFSEKALDNIFKALDLGKPFEPDDIVVGSKNLVTGSRFFTCK